MNAVPGVSVAHPHDVSPGPRLGSCAEGEEPIVVRRPAGPPHPRRPRRAACEGSAHADRPDRDCAGAGRRAPGIAYCFIGKEAGVGGLPTGTGGRLVALLSGGIDSPAAAWRMMRGGCFVTVMHFHSAPFLSNASQEKARKLAEVLTTHQRRSKL